MKPTKQTPTGGSQSEPEARRNFAAPLKEGSGENEIENALEPEARRNFAAPLNRGKTLEENSGAGSALEPGGDARSAGGPGGEGRPAGGPGGEGDQAGGPDEEGDQAGGPDDEVPAGAGWLWCHTLTASNPMQLGGSSIPTATVCVGRDGVRSIAVLPSGVALVTYQPGDRKPVLLASWVKADLLSHNGGPVTRKGGRPKKHG